MAEPETPEEITVELPGYGHVLITWAQAQAIAVAIKELHGRGLVPTWHPNECGCCVSVHDDVEHPDAGWLIGRDGGSDWISRPHGPA